MQRCDARDAIKAFSGQSQASLHPRAGIQYSADALNTRGRCESSRETDRAPARARIFRRAGARTRLCRGRSPVRSDNVKELGALRSCDSDRCAASRPARPGRCDRVSLNRGHSKSLGVFNSSAKRLNTATTNASWNRARQDFCAECAGLGHSWINVVALMNGPGVAGFARRQ